MSLLGNRGSGGTRNALLPNLDCRLSALRHDAMASLTEEPGLDLVIAGGGPAGMMAGLLFARAGCKVDVLEKHVDFFRDFRGDTVHPSTLEILRELGLSSSS